MIERCRVKPSKNFDCNIRITGFNANINALEERPKTALLNLYCNPISPSSHKIAPTPFRPRTTFSHNSRHVQKAHKLGRNQKTPICSHPHSTRYSVYLLLANYTGANMAWIECKSAQPNIKSIMVEVGGITNNQVLEAHKILNELLEKEDLISNAIAKGYLEIVDMCPEANPSDLWQQIVYRYALSIGWNDNKWKRVSGFALERALSFFYEPILVEYNMRMVNPPITEIEQELSNLSVDVPPSKTDLLLQSNKPSGWHLFGAVHVKASIAERIQDDVPASVSLMDAGLISVILTMDAKSFPPPHGDCVNYGELGGRNVSSKHNPQRIKRDYVEKYGQFDALFSYNLRTPESPPETSSGKRIYTLSFSKSQPDKFVKFLLDHRGTG